jgi:hypothetical protein
MEVFEVIKLFGACVAFIVGTIVFLVLFFRGMAWIDVWVRERPASDDKRRKARRSKDTKQVIQLREQEVVASQVRKSSPVKRVISNIDVNAPNKAATLQWSNGFGSLHMSDRPTFVHADTDPTQSEPTSELLAEPQPLSEPCESKVETSRSAKGVSRTAIVHLLTGETIDRVTFCSREKASKICEGLGFEGVVLEDREGHICVVRESNIKMVTWKAV